MSELDQIRNCLADTSPGKLPEVSVRQVETMLSACWDRLAGSRNGGMAAFKLLKRTEDMEWNPPTLTFKIERQGGLVNGSKRAEVQEWRVDLQNETAALRECGKRQVLPMDRRLNVKPIAAEIAAIIDERREDRRIRWRGTNSVRVLTGEVIPTTNQQTTSSRRKRFAEELERHLRPLGWERTNAGNQLVFERQNSG